MAVLTCPAVAAGPHTILVTATPRRGAGRAPEPPPMWGSAAIVASGKPLELRMTLFPGERLTGRAAIDGLADLPGIPSGLFLQLEVVDSPFKPLIGVALPGVIAAETGEFSFESVPPGQYRLALEQTDPWMLTAATLDGRDVLDLPFHVSSPWVSDIRVTFSKAITTLSGRVLGADGAARPRETVVIFAADGRFWLPGSRRVHSARTGLTGRYEFRGLPAGQYFLVVDSGGLFDDAWDSGVLVQLSRSARRIVLGPGQALSQDLTGR